MSRTVSRTRRGLDADESGGDGNREALSAEEGCFCSEVAPAGSQCRFDGVALDTDDRGYVDEAGERVLCEAASRGRLLYSDRYEGSRT